MSLMNPNQPTRPRLSIPRRVFRAALLVTRVVLTLVILLLSVRLYGPASADYGPSRLGPDVLSQLRFIRAQLDAGTAADMQKMFPEGFFFIHALYGMTWIEVARREDVSPLLKTQAIAEATWALGRLDSDEGRATFDLGLDPPLGVFAVGWSAFLRAGVLMVQPPGERSPFEIERLRAQCDSLAHAFDRQGPFLLSYKGQAWPCDSVVAVAALRLHDHVLAPRYKETVARWIAQTKQLIGDEPFPHRWIRARPLERPRGSSQSIIHRFLIEVDPAWGRMHYARFRREFVSGFVGLPGVREYPRGTASGSGDVDSGPVIAGLSASASVVTIAAANAHGDQELADALFHSSECAGFPISWNNRKFYALGLMPIGDAFLAWAKSSTAWTCTPPQTALAPILPSHWRLRAHAAAAVFLAVLWLAVPVGRRAIAVIRARRQ